MNTKLLLASMCFLFLNFAPGYSDLSVQIQKDGNPPGLAVNTPNADRFVTDQVRQALATVKEFNNINVEAKDGIVTLTGTVSDEAVKTVIGEKVANVPGVKSVDNRIEVSK